MFGHKSEPVVVNINSTTNNYYEYCGPHKVHLILTLNKNLHIMALEISSNQKVLGTLGLTDAVTNLAVTGTFSNVTANSDQSGIFTASVDEDNDIVVTGVTPGAGTLTVSALCAFTDSTGAAQSVTKTAAIPVTVLQVITADDVNLIVTFGNPTAQ